MDRVGRLLLAVVLLSASLCTVQGTRRRIFIRFYESTRTGTDTLIAIPLRPEHVQAKGWTWVQHEGVRSITDESKILGFMGGVFFYHSAIHVEQVGTITFNTNAGGIFSGSSLILRGLWKLSGPGAPESEEQELAIVGGQGALSGATGSVIYKQVSCCPPKFLVTCNIIYDDYADVIDTTPADLNSLYRS